MSGQNIDRDKLRTALRRLRNEEIYYILGEALEMLPPSKLQKLIKGYFDLSQLRPEAHRPKNLLEEVKAFEQASPARRLFRKLRRQLQELHRIIQRDAGLDLRV